jgi:hypothetical protein
MRKITNWIEIRKIDEMFHDLGSETIAIARFEPPIKLRVE